MKSPRDKETKFIVKEIKWVGNLLYKKQVWQPSCREWNGGEVRYELQLSHDLRVNQHPWMHQLWMRLFWDETKSFNLNQTKPWGGVFFIASGPSLRFQPPPPLSFFPSSSILLLLFHCCCSLFFIIFYFFAYFFVVAIDFFSWSFFSFHFYAILVFCFIFCLFLLLYCYNFFFHHHLLFFFFPSPSSSIFFIFHHIIVLIAIACCTII